MKTTLTLIALFSLSLMSSAQIVLGPFPEQLRVCPCGDTTSTKYQMFLFEMKGTKYTQGALIKCPGVCEDQLYGLRGNIEDGLWTRFSPAIKSFDDKDIQVYEYADFLYLFSGKKYYRYSYQENSFAHRSKSAYMRDCRNQLCRN